MNPFVPYCPKCSMRRANQLNRPAFWFQRRTERWTMVMCCRAYGEAPRVEKPEAEAKAELVEWWRKERDSKLTETDKEKMETWLDDVEFLEENAQEILESGGNLHE